MIRKSGIFATAALAAVSVAHAADLPTKKAPLAPPPAKSCFASFWDYLQASAADCPLSYLGITVYGQVDVGAGYESHASAFNRNWAQGVSELVAKTGQGSRFQWIPNGLSQSNIGIKGKEEFLPGWFFIFDVNTGFDPYSFQLANGPASLVDNNGKPLIKQSAQGDSSRAGQWDNTRAYSGVSNATFGTLTAGRQYTFSTDAVNKYDPMGGSYAFSLIGYSSTYVGGVGDTEVARYNTSVKYQIAYNNFRAGAVWQFGGYSLGNGTQGAYQFDLGADYNGFSIDAIYSYAKDAVALGTYASPFPKGVTADDLKATLADIGGAIVAASYTYGPIKGFGGYEYARFSNPSDKYAGGFGVIGGDYTVLPNTVNAGSVTYTAYTNNKILQVAWAGAKYSITSDLDVTGAYYWAGQNNYSPAGSPASYCAGNKTAAVPGAAPQGAAHSTCSGHLQAVSGLVDWRPVKRLDLYAGVMFSAAAGGIANGYIHSTNIAPTVGARLTF